MNNCEYYQALLSRQLDEKLANEDEQELLKHLKECSECADFFQSISSIRTKLLATNTPMTDKNPISQGSAQSLITKIWNMKIKLPMPVAAALVIFIALSLVINISNNLVDKPTLPEQPAVISGESYQMVYMAPQPSKKVSQNNKPNEVTK